MFAAGVTPYTPADLGIPTPPPGSPLATLPAISDNERATIEETLRAMNEMGYLSQEYFQKSSIAAWESIRYVPINDQELDAKIENAINGTSYTPKSAPPKEHLFQRESKLADDFYTKIQAQFPTLTNQELINVRKQLTMTLAITRIQMDYNDPAGLPQEFLLMARDKAVALRQKVNLELIKRGVTQI
ncbi:hypothetical protein DLM75_14860 [Leptospira stimsonii]|uniref:Uncharacterized protein n=1 Tax=Leptospira stimsonii TaxID=2202203 RepID=A0A396Z6W8_9LEPT|nr:hypothetical protein DLM75_14860 [Leptospira stimsonii]